MFLFVLFAFWKYPQLFYVNLLFGDHMSRKGIPQMKLRHFPWRYWFKLVVFYKRHFHAKQSSIETLQLEATSKVLAGLTLPRWQPCQSLNFVQYTEVWSKLSTSSVMRKIIHKQISKMSLATTNTLAPQVSPKHLVTICQIEGERGWVGQCSF